MLTFEFNTRQIPNKYTQIHLQRFSKNMHDMFRLFRSILGSTIKLLNLLIDYFFQSSMVWKFFILILKWSIQYTISSNETLCERFTISKKITTVDELKANVFIVISILMKDIMKWQLRSNILHINPFSTYFLGIWHTITSYYVYHERRSKNLNNIFYILISTVRRHLKNLVCFWNLCFTVFSRRYKINTRDLW